MFIDSFLDFMPDTLTVLPIVRDSRGDIISSGSTLSLPCRIEGEARLVRDAGGREVMSRVQVLVPYTGLTVDAHQYTLPPRYTPHADLTPISVDQANDEDEPVYNELYF